MLNTNVTNVLQQINGITDTVILKYPTTIINSGPGDVIAKLDMKELDEDEFKDIGLFSLGEFLNVLKLFPEEDRSIEFKDNTIHVNAGKMISKYPSTQISLLSDYDKGEKVFTVTEAVPTVCSFTLTSEDMKKIKSASSVFKELTDIVIESIDGVTIVSLGAGTSFNTKSSSFSVEMESETTKEFKLHINAQNFNNLPNSDYEVMVKYNSAKNAYRVLLNSTDINMSILLAVKK